MLDLLIIHKLDIGVYSSDSYFYLLNLQCCSITTLDCQTEAMMSKVQTTGCNVTCVQVEAAMPSGQNLVLLSQVKDVKQLARFRKITLMNTYVV